MNDLERELEAELHRALDPLASTAIPLRRAARPLGYPQRVLGSAGAVLAFKVATVVAVAAAATTVAGAATTGSLNPTTWGERVTDQVQTCRKQIEESGGHGIGECVSDVAKTHGEATSDAKQHHGNPNPHSDTGTGGGPTNQAPGKDNSKGQSQQNAVVHSSPKAK